MAAKLLFIAIAALAVVPAAASALWSDQSGEDVTRTVQLNGPFIEFEQTRERIQVRLASVSGENEKRDRIIVSDADGHEIAIPLKRGQTWASAELPPDLASAPGLAISLQP